MKKVILLTIVVASALALAYSGVNEQSIAAAKGHLIFDDVDGVYRCLGSASNCA